jgi:hypothetical protein
LLAIDILGGFFEAAKIGENRERALMDSIRAERKMTFYHLGHWEK